MVSRIFSSVNPSVPIFSLGYIGEIRLILQLCLESERVAGRGFRVAISPNRAGGEGAGLPGRYRADSSLMPVALYLR